MPKVVALCTSSLVQDCEQERGEGKGKDQCESILIALTAPLLSNEEEESLAQAKANVNSGIWDAAQVRSLVVSVRVALVLDWLRTRSDTVLSPSQQSILNRKGALFLRVISPALSRNLVGL